MPLFPCKETLLFSGILLFVANKMEVETSLLLHKSRRLEWVNMGEYLNKRYSSAVYYSEETVVTTLLFLLQ
jgi:hypothetical protein